MSATWNFKRLWRTGRRGANPAARSGSAMPRLEPLESRDMLTCPGPILAPFRLTEDCYLGTPIVRPGYDLQPSILHTPGAGARTFQMWWLGDYRPGDVDLPPSDLPVGDRIYYSQSSNGDAWSAPQVVLKGRGGYAGFDAADDHLLGSPSVMKIGNTYHMFYEAYATWATTINRLYSSTRSDNWITNGVSDAAGNLFDGHASYAGERVDGFAPLHRKPGTHPIYSGEVAFQPDGKIDRFVRTTPIQEGIHSGGNWRRLNGGTPIFWLYDQGGQGRAELYSCWHAGQRNTWATTSAFPLPPCDGVPGAQRIEPRLGYVATSLNTPDMIGSLQNRIMLATSTDGVNWTRFQGAARGGAVVAPLNELSNHYPHNCGQQNPEERWGIHGAYGSGLPVALERDGQLELYFSDDSQRPATACSWPPEPWRIRIPVSQILNAQAYVTAARQNNAGYGGDMKWSPLYQRYFATYLSPANAPMLIWSHPNPNPNLPPTFPTDGTGWPVGITLQIPAQRRANWGGLAGDGLGHTLDNDDGTRVYTAFHLYYPEYPAGGHPYHQADLGHSVVFGYPERGEIRGSVFNDLNGNGQYDTGESWLPGVRIYADRNDNGQFETGEPSVFTDAAGNYRLADLDPRHYLVRMVPPSGWIQSYPAGGYHSVALGVGQTVTGKDFGAFQPVGRPLVVDGTAAADTLVLQDRPGDPSFYEVWRNNEQIMFGRWVTVSNIVLRGGAGDDQIRITSAQYAARNLPTRLEGGDGHDSLSGGAGNDTLEGGEGADSLYGGVGNDLLNGHAGNDHLEGHDGHDTLYGSDDYDRLLGGNGNDLLSGGYFHDVLEGQAGNDTLYGGHGHDRLDGQEGNDQLYGEDGNDSLYGGLGGDFLAGGASNDTLAGGAGDDILEGGTQDDVLQGQDGDDQLYGEDGQDSLSGGRDNDDLRGGLGDDSLDGQEGNDTLHGQAGNDGLWGSDGQDALYGHEGDDLLFGEAGNDWMNGGPDNDYLEGAQGNDTLYGSDGHDWLFGGIGQDLLGGEVGFDLLYGGEENDVLDGGLDEDILLGEDGSDWLQGGSGNDLLIAGWGGPDTLQGGDGTDVLVAGATVFDYRFDVLWTVLYDPWTQLIPGETVFSNYTGNTLLGGEDVDLFFACSWLDLLEDWDPWTEPLVELC